MNEVPKQAPAEPSRSRSSGCEPPAPSYPQYPTTPVAVEDRWSDPPRRTSSNSWRQR